MGSSGERDGEHDSVAPLEDVLRWIRSEVLKAGRRHRLGGADLDDLHQDACVRVFEKIPEWRTDGGASVETWARRHTNWAIGDFIRGKIRRDRVRGAGDDVSEVADGRDEAPTAQVERAELRAALERCMEKLPPTQRSRFLRAISATEERMSRQQLARALSIGLESLKDSLRRARRQMRECLDRSGLLPWPHDDGGDRPRSARGMQ